MKFSTTLYIYILNCTCFSVLRERLFLIPIPYSHSLKKIFCSHSHVPIPLIPIRFSKALFIYAKVSLAYMYTSFSRHHVLRTTTLLHSASLLFFFCFVVLVGTG